MDEAVAEVLKGLEAFSEEDVTAEFDEMVHDAKSAEASDINNAGLEAQARYILEGHGMTQEAIASIVKTVSGNLDAPKV
jgi:hypothetical protein